MRVSRSGASGCARPTAGMPDECARAGTATCAARGIGFRSVADRYPMTEPWSRAPPRARKNSPAPALARTVLPGGAFRLLPAVLLAMLPAIAGPGARATTIAPVREAGLI